MKHGNETKCKYCGEMVKLPSVKGKVSRCKCGASVKHIGWAFVWGKAVSK